MIRYGEQIKSTEILQGSEQRVKNIQAKNYEREK